MANNPRDLGNQIANRNALIGTEVDVPFQKGVKGKIIDDLNDTYGIEYTGPNGVTRQDRFARTDYIFPSTAEENLADFQNRIGVPHLSEAQYKEFLRPKVKASYEEYKNANKNLRQIRGELKDAYGYDDLINEAMGTTADDDWNNAWDELAKAKPDKIDVINKIKAEKDPEKRDLYLAFLGLINGEAR